MSTVYYKRRVKGRTIPAIINNIGYNYYDMPVYEDGSIDCWEQVCFSKITRKLDSGWLTFKIPVGENIDFHGLGFFKILDAKWDYPKKEHFKQHIVETIKEMNPELVGIFEESSLATEKWAKQFLSNEVPYKIEDNFFKKVIDGESIHIFYKLENSWILTALNCYQDQTISLDFVPEKEFTFEEIKEMFEKGELTCNPKSDFKLVIKGLGILQVTSIDEIYDDNEKVKEIEDLLNKLRGEKTTLQLCREVYHEYLEYPNEYTRKHLKETYEAVPEHERLFLGDMDSKDGDFRRIIYHPEKKREV